MYILIISLLAPFGYYFLCADDYYDKNIYFTILAFKNTQKPHHN